MPTDHDLLVEINALVREMHKAINGNGKPGLIRDIVVLQEDMRKRELEALELRAGVPSKRDKALVSSGVLASAIVAAAMAVRELFGV